MFNFQGILDMDSGLYAEILQGGGGGGGWSNLRYLKKEEVQLQEASGGAVEDNI